MSTQVADETVSIEESFDQLDYSFPVAPSVTKSASALINSMAFSTATRNRRPQEGMVVLRVADGDNVERRQAERRQRRRESTRLVDAGRQHHHRALVEDDLQLETELLDRIEHLGLIPGCHVATMDRPTERGDTSRRRNAAMNSAGGGGASGRSSAVEGR